MADEVAAVAEAVAEATEAKEIEEDFPVSGNPSPTKKEELYRDLATRLNMVVERKRGKGRQCFGDNHGRDILVAVIDGLVDIVLQPMDSAGRPAEGSVGIPGGYGSMQLGTAAATRKVTPQGKEIDVPIRWRMVWRPGKTVDDRLHALPPPVAAVAVPVA